MDGLHAYRDCKRQKAFERKLCEIEQSIEELNITINYIINNFAEQCTDVRFTNVEVVTPENCVPVPRG